MDSVSGSGFEVLAQLGTFSVSNNLIHLFYSGNSTDSFLSKKFNCERYAYLSISKSYLNSFSIQKLNKNRENKYYLFIVNIVHSLLISNS